MLLSALSMQIHENQSETRDFSSTSAYQRRVNPNPDEDFSPSMSHTRAHTHTSTDLSYCSLIALRIKEDAKHKVKKKIMG